MHVLKLRRCFIDWNIPPTYVTQGNILKENNCELWYLGGFFWLLFPFRYPDCTSYFLYHGSLSSSQCQSIGLYREPGDVYMTTGVKISITKIFHIFILFFLLKIFPMIDCRCVFFSHKLHYRLHVLYITFF